MFARAVALLGLLLVAALCPAEPQFWETFKKHYHPAANSSINKAQCVTCHVAQGDTHRNTYGRALQLLVAASQDQQLTMEMLQQVQAQDSDGDGFSNIAEINAGTLPGDPASRPGGRATSDPTTATPPLIPTHSFHPLLVHLPIGIFLFGVFYDMIGRLFKKKELRNVAKYSLQAGAATSVIAVISGILAMLRMGKPLEGAMLNHLVLGVATMVLAIVIAVWRHKSEPSGPFYWLVLGAAALALSVAGHIGASMVWG